MIAAAELDLLVVDTEYTVVDPVLGVAINCKVAG